MNTEPRKHPAIESPPGRASPARPAARGGRGERQPWVRPQLKVLPPLTKLTLVTGSPIGGFGDVGSGSTVF
ncbi:hypothetical protein HRbin33_02036 [bacterium HR33]|nr:hypothetical protein HRbin33_02036 [bacterium HR33]